MTAGTAGTVDLRAGVRSDYRCVGCGYGVVTTDALPRCPMCGGSTWDHAEWRPFSSLPPEPAAAAPVERPAP
jgi:hypothetical protein